MATSYTAFVTATGGGRNGGRVTADDGLLAGCVPGLTSRRYS